MNLKTYSLDEIRKHNRKSDCWVIIDKCVYDLTTFLPEHPGGEDLILDVAGEDATDDFYYVDAHQSEYTESTLASYLIGKVEDSSLPKNSQYQKPQSQLQSQSQQSQKFQQNISQLLSSSSSPSSSSSTTSPPVSSLLTSNRASLLRSSNPKLNNPSKRPSYAMQDRAYSSQYSSQYNSNSTLADSLSFSTLNPPVLGRLPQIGPATNRPQISADEVRKHNHMLDAWIVIDNKVFNVTQFMHRHPGGSKLILQYAGTDCSDAFHHVNGHLLPHTIQRLQECYIGDVVLSKDGTSTVPIATIPSKNVQTSSGVINVKANLKHKNLQLQQQQQQQLMYQTYPCTIESINVISPDTGIVVFRLKTGYTLPMSVGKHVNISYIDPVTKTNTMRSYTPIAILEGGTAIRFVIKQYKTKDSFARFILSQRKSLPSYIKRREDGGVSSGSGMGSMLMSDTSQSQSQSQSQSSPPPILEFVMSSARGDFNFSTIAEGRFDKIIMFCAGTGIAPMYQILHKIIISKFRTPNNIALYVVNRTVHDILLYENIDELANCYCDSCKRSRKESKKNNTITKPTFNSNSNADGNTTDLSISEVLLQKISSLTTTEFSQTRNCVMTQKPPTHTKLHISYILTKQILPKVSEIISDSMIYIKDDINNNNNNINSINNSITPIPISTPLPKKEIRLSVTTQENSTSNLSPPSPDDFAYSAYKLQQEGYNVLLGTNVGISSNTNEKLGKIFLKENENEMESKMVHSIANFGTSANSTGTHRPNIETHYGSNIVLRCPTTPLEWNSIIPSCYTPKYEISEQNNNESILALICGPDQFCDSIEKLLQGYGYSNSTQISSSNTTGEMKITSKHSYFRF